MKKRGISAVVATILIILIVVIGVGIVWKVILPIFQELEFLSYSDVQLNIVRQGFTVYDPEQNFAFVQIERGEDEVNVTGVEIGFNFGGTTKTYQSKRVPTPNGKYTYKFNFTNDSDMGIPQNVTPDKVTVAPIFRINNKVRLGKILDSEDMPVGRIRLSKEEWEAANDEAATAIVVSGGNNDEPGKPVELVVPIDPSIVCNAQNNSAYDNGTVINECLYGCTSGVCNEPSCVDLGKVDYNGGCAIPVDSCGTLNAGVENYVLNQSIVNDDLTGDCIIISAENIVLDCQGYSISSEDSYSGIYSNQDHTSIKNCNISMKSGHFGGSAISIGKAKDAQILDNSLHDSAIGILLSPINNMNALVKGNTIDNNEYGIYLKATDFGFYSTYNNIVENNLTRNGVVSEDGGTAQGNGIYIYKAKYNNITNNIINNNNGVAISLDTYADHTTLVGNEINNNFHGLSIRRSSNNFIEDNEINGNRHRGIRVSGASFNTYKRNEISNNERGIDNTAIDSFFEDNIVCNNQYIDFECTNYYSSSAASGGGNNFTTVDVCMDGWPEEGTHYTSCA